MRRMNTPDAPTVYRVVLERLLPDGSAPYLPAEYYGPYATLGAARGQETTILYEATRDGRKARTRIESAPLAWTPLAWGEARS